MVVELDGTGNGAVDIDKGGTNATTAAGARTSLGVAASGANSDITSLSGLTTPLSIAQGGTNSATLAGGTTRILYQDGSGVAGDADLTWDDVNKNIKVGTVSVTSKDPGFFHGRTISSEADNAHAFVDNAVFENTTGTNNAYNSFDSYPELTGAAQDHLAGYQARGRYNAAGGTLDYWRGFYSLPVATLGTIDDVRHLQIKDTIGVGTVNSQYGVHIESLVKGGVNYAIYSEGSTPSYHGGKFGVGIIPTMDLEVHATSGNAVSQIQSASGFSSNRIYSHSDTTWHGAYISGYRSKGTASSPTAVVNDNISLSINGKGYDGSTYVDGSQIVATVQGSVSTGVVPMSLILKTMDSGGTLNASMTINASGVVNIKNTPTYADNAAAKTGGLVDGDVYRTATGALMVVYT